MLYHKLYEQLMHHKDFFLVNQDTEYLKYNIQNLEKLFGISHEDFVAEAKNYIKIFPSLKELIY
jgi:hypothetical protein